MKRKIIIGLVLFSLVFISGGTFIITGIEKATRDINDLIMLHQVEILREKLLIQVQNVQTSLQLKNTRHSAGIDRVVRDVRDMEMTANSCFDCHHSEGVSQRIEDLAKIIDEYKHNLSRVFTVRANVKRLMREEDNAIKVGDKLIGKIDSMIAFTSSRLESRTKDTLAKINGLKKFFYLLLAIGPFVAIGLAFVLMKHLTASITSLQEATDKIKEGELDYAITGLEDEFGEVANSFNIMAGSLREHMSKISQSEEKYRAVVNQSADCIFLVDVETKRIIEANESLARLLGYRNEELTGLTLYEFVAHDPRDVDQKAQSIISEKGHFLGERQYVRKDGSLVDVDVSANLIDYGGRQVISVVSRDISQRKSVEAALRESEKRYRKLFESAGDAIFIIGAETENAGKIVSANKAAAEMHGYTVEELLQMNIRELDTLEAAKGVSERLTRILHGEWIHEEITHRKKDGTVFPVEISAGLLDFEDHKYVLAFDRDISERRYAEKELKRAEHLRVVGELAAGLVHEIKNPLTGIKVSMEVFSQELDVSDEDRAIMFKVVSEIKRIELLMKSLLNYARPPRPHFMTTDINYIIDKTLTLSLEYPSFRSSNSNEITIVKDLNEEIPSTIVDPMQIQQVFLNLFLNAADSMPDGGVLTVTTYYDTYAKLVNIEISDTGIGIGEDLIEKVFDPFFTTKSKGSGLGLAITKQIIEQHGGTIDVSSRSEGGTTFRITFPCFRSKEESIT
jgi:PAS domain S-box-containing protein